MSRVLFKRAPRGHRLVRGEPIRRVQQALKNLNFNPETIDGIFGADTEAAVLGWQRHRAFTPTGTVTFDEWTALTDQPAPGLRDRSLQLTADFEQHGFGKIVGNFDDAWLTWGIIGFTLKHGELQRILNEVHIKHPELLERAFGARVTELTHAINAGPAEQEAFANRISLGRNRYKVEPFWADAFAVLGGFPEVQEIQMRGVDKYWQIALRDAKRFSLEHELGVALCFDIAVQNGGIDSQTEETSIRRRLAQNPPVDEMATRVLIADVVAENSKPKYVEDVRSRKRTIATGAGFVHGVSYGLADWGLADVTIAT